MIADESFLYWTWRELRGQRRHILLRLAMSFVSGLALLAATLVGAWVWAQVAGLGRVQEEELGSALTLGGALWLGALVWLWRNAGVALNVIWTVAIGAAVLGLSFTVARVLHVQEPEYPVGALLFVGLGGILLVWLPLLVRRLRHRPLTDPENNIRVNCPQCGYSLVGLRELRCPECGTRFTLDELIRAQNYAGADERPPPLGSGANAAAPPDPHVHLTRE